MKENTITQMKEFATKLKESGFTVLISKKHPFEWLHYEKNGNFGTVNPSYSFNFNFGTIHKPCRECGTGFSTDRERELTIENATNSLHIPGWANRKDLEAVKQYKSVNEFISHSNNKWAEYYIL